MKETKTKTIFCDIDGTIFKHVPPTLSAKPLMKLELLEGVLEKFMEWEKKEYKIILVTGRRESMRSSTETQLKKHGIFYDQLIMGLGRGIRIIINDKKTNGAITAQAISLDRDIGLKNVNV